MMVQIIKKYLDFYYYYYYQAIISLEVIKFEVVILNERCTDASSSDNA